MVGTTELQTAGIVLAAGASRRMGTNKLLLEFAGEPLVRRAVRRAFAAGLAPVVVVVGPEAEQVRTALQGVECEFAINADAGGQMSGSVHAGLQGLPASVDAVIIMLADMPQVTENMLTALNSSTHDSAPLVVSVYAGVTAPPILFRRPLFAELMECTGEGIGRRVVQRHLADAALIQWPPEALRDVDTPEEFADLQANAD